MHKCLLASPIEICEYNVPVRWFHGYLLVHQLAALLKDEMTPVCLSSLTGAQSCYEYAFWI